MDSLGISDATVERMARDERLRSTLMAVPGRKGERVFYAEDVERLKAQKERRRELAPPSTKRQRQITAAGEDGNSAVISIKPGPAFTLPNLRELLGEWAEQRAEIDLREKLWLTWDEAAELSGIPVAYVREAAKGGKIKAERFGRSWRVLRKSLESYEG